MADEKTFTKDELDAAVEKAVGKVQESIERLETKNAELLDEKKAADRKLRAASEIKPEDLTAAEERAEKAEASLATAQKDLKAAVTRAEKAEASLETETGFTQQLLISDGIKSALIAVGVKDEDFLDTLSARFAKDAKVTVDADKRNATIGDKPLGDHIKEWAASDAGKKFVAAAVNSGGGAGGGDNKGTGKTIAKADFDALRPKERSAKMDEGYVVVEPAS